MKARIAISIVPKLLRQTGFTLLEILIGMSLLGVMMLLLFGSLRICVQNWDAGEDKIAQAGQAAIIQNFFINHLQNLLPLQDNFSEVKQFSFQGDASHIQFVSTMPASAGRLGLQIFTIALDNPKATSGSLTVSMRPFFPVTNGGTDWKTEKVVILKDVKQLIFSYYGLDDQKPAEPALWQAVWLDKKETPLMVGISIGFLNGIVWPEIVVALKVDKSGGAAATTNPFGISSDGSRFN